VESVRAMKIQSKGSSPSPTTGHRSLTARTTVRSCRPCPSSTLPQPKKALLFARCERVPQEKCLLENDFLQIGHVCLFKTDTVIVCVALLGRGAMCSFDKAGDSGALALLEGLNFSTWRPSRDLKAPEATTLQVARHAAAGTAFGQLIGQMVVLQK